MLYPKREHPLTEGEFKNPTSEYRATPFWSWNTKLDKEDLVWQIGELKKMGYGGFHMHPRVGLATPYLSDEFMDAVKACVEKGRQEKMLPWLYDEDRWPSGAAGGLVTKNPAYRQRYLLLTRRPYAGQGPGVTTNVTSTAAADRAENGTLLACYDVTLDKDGCLASYRRSDPKDPPQSGFKFYVYAETSLPSPWFNDQTYVDTLNPAAMREFIKVTYERYAAYFQKDFGSLIHAIFTDEPQFSTKGTLLFANEDRDVTLPWTGDFPDTYQAAYGEDLLEKFPELMWELPEGKVSVTRYRYHDHVAERFAAAFADQCGGWCAKHGLMLTGHMMEEPSLESQTHSLGEAMRSYRSFGLPGIDMLCDGREFTTAKQAQSATHQYGYPGVTSELYGVTNWDFDFRGHKLQGDWQAALGVTVRVPHLSWVSMNGEAKRDYPGTFNYQAPWYKEYPYVEDHFARVNTALTRGRAVVRVGVVHPIESFWLHWGPRENTEAVRSGQDTNFRNLCDWLLRGFVDFDYICESTLPGLCAVEDVSRGAKKFPVGKMAYSTIVVPAMETIRATTLDRLEAFAQAGGRLLFLGPAPSYVDAVPSDRGRKLWEKSERVGFERLAVLKALEGERELRMRDSSGGDANGFVYQMREDGGDRWVFIAHADRQRSRDIPNWDDFRLHIRGAWRVVRYDTLDGSVRAVESEALPGGWTRVNLRIGDHDSFLFKLEDPASKSVIPPVPERPGVRTWGLPCVRFTGPVPVTLEEPNVLLLDIAEFTLDDGAWRPREEILRLDSILRRAIIINLVFMHLFLDQYPY